MSTALILHAIVPHADEITSVSRSARIHEPGFKERHLEKGFSELEAADAASGQTIVNRCRYRTS
jgi:hypothetical protein